MQYNCAHSCGTCASFDKAIDNSHRTDVCTDNEFDCKVKGLDLIVNTANTLTRCNSNIFVEVMGSAGRMRVGECIISFV